jgi:hypothetical protein
VVGLLNYEYVLSCRNLRVGKYFRSNATTSATAETNKTRKSETYLEACDASCAALPCGASEKKERELGVFQVVVKTRDTNGDLDLSGELLED